MRRTELFAAAPTFVRAISRPPPPAIFAMITSMSSSNALTAQYRAGNGHSPTAEELLHRHPLEGVCELAACSTMAPNSSSVITSSSQASRMVVRRSTVSSKAALTPAVDEAPCEITDRERHERCGDRGEVGEVLDHSSPLPEPTTCTSLTR